MSSTPIRRSIASVQLHRNESDRLAQAAQPIPKKRPLSERPINGGFPQRFDTLEDVSFLRLPEVKAVTGLSKTSIYELIRAKTFPAPVRLGPRAVAWVKSEVKQWALERVHASRSVA